MVKRASRSRVSSAAAAVSTLVVDAGCIGMSAPCAHSCVPVIASVIRPVKMPRFGSARAGASVAASLSGVGLGAESATGTMPGSAVAEGGSGLTACASLVECRPAVSTAATATTAATSSSTDTPITTWVDRRHRVGRITLLTLSCHSRVALD